MRAALALAAFVMSARLGFMARLASLDALKALDALICELRALNDMLKLRPSTLAELAMKLKSPVWAHFARELSSPDNAEEAWTRALKLAGEKNAAIKALSAAFPQRLAGVGEALTLFDPRAQQNALELTINMLERDAAPYREEKTRRAKLYSTLGVLAGLGAALLII